MSTSKLPSAFITHDRNDETVEHIYVGRCFKNDTERLGKLFEMYKKMTEGPKRRSGTMMKA